MEPNGLITSFCTDTLLPLYKTYYQPEKRAAVQVANRQFWWMLGLTVLAPGLAAAYFTSLLTAFYFFVLLLVLSEILYLVEIAKIYQKVSIWTTSFAFLVNMLLLWLGHINFANITGLRQVFSTFGDSDQPIFNTLTVGILVLPLLSLALVHQSDDFKNFLRIDYTAFKQRAIDLFFQQFHPDFTLENGRHFTRTILDSTGLFDRIDEVNEQDIIRGTIDGRAVVFAEMTLVKITKTDKQTHRSTIFKGLMVEMQLTWSPIHAVILKKQPGWNPIDLFIEDGKEVKMEDGEFEQRFQVLAADKMEVYRILSPQVMQDLVLLNKQYPDMPGLCFSTNSGLYFALPMRDDLFEVELEDDWNGIAARFTAIYGIMERVKQVCGELGGLRVV